MHVRLFDLSGHSRLIEVSDSFSTADRILYPCRQVIYKITVGGAARKHRVFRYTGTDVNGIREYHEDLNG